MQETLDTLRVKKCVGVLSTHRDFQCSALWEDAGFRRAVARAHTLSATCMKDGSVEILVGEGSKIVCRAHGEFELTSCGEIPESEAYFAAVLGALRAFEKTEFACDYSLTQTVHTLRFPFHLDLEAYADAHQDSFYMDSGASPYLLTLLEDPFRYVVTKREGEVEIWCPEEPRDLCTLGVRDHIARGVRFRRGAL